MTLCCASNSSLIKWTQRSFVDSDLLCGHNYVPVCGCGSIALCGCGSTALCGCGSIALCVGVAL